jgi:hypothetical protein
LFLLDTRKRLSLPTARKRDQAMGVVEYVILSVCAAIFVIGTAHLSAPSSLKSNLGLLAAQLSVLSLKIHLQALNSRKVHITFYCLNLLVWPQILAYRLSFPLAI